MAQKTVWLTWMPADDVALAPQPVVNALSKVGLAGAGAPWIDAPADYAWAELARQLQQDGAPDAWLIAGRAADFANPAHRFGLSMVAATLASSDRAPHAALLGLDGTPDAQALPTVLRAAQALDGSGSAWPAKLLVALSATTSATTERFRMRAHADKMFGNWLEFGPRDGTWAGAMVGVCGDAEITNHAVGPAGGLPERTVLEYKLEGIELEIADDAFVAWAVQNRIGSDESYYVKVDGSPSKLLIGEHPDSDPEVSVLSF